MSNNSSGGQDQNRWSELASIASQLSREHAELSEQQSNHVAILAKYTRKTRKIVYSLIASLILDLFLTGFLAFTHAKLDNVTKNVQYSQTVQRQRVLCPLYTVFLQSRSAEGRKRAPDPKKYDEAFKVIADGYRTLECQNVVEAPFQKGN